ncbi:hypothetical protein LRB11_15195 [Ectothiorhodospira haloalkaliphila]|uniref:hypothetical protein n=1 Tax=Ectothiorhodospira haloalkaliphila TaxID=421628 RepID=UPI001EE8FE59|nr:hypothetical protein [Ectothiorhodospira haloalkaliphila]MCG5526261.1 hypothetical protein [Ectothiorhodospira haloalkaliphila]
MKSSLYRWADRWAVRLADRMGVTLARAKPLDLRGRDIHPLEAYYLAGRYQPVLMDVPVSKLRGLGSAAFPCTKDSGHPFIETLLEYESGKVRTYAGSALERFYRSWQPKNAAEYFGFDASSATGQLKDLLPVEAVFPWYNVSPYDMRERYRRELTIVHQKNYGNRFLRNWLECGPVDDDFLENEFSRLLAVYSSVMGCYERNSGSDGDITGLLMLHEEGWFIHVQSGQHRTAALAALGVDKVPVRLFFRLPMVVRREEVDYWPNVSNGLFSAHQALIVFDRMRNGFPPWQN